jgi:hypothetical protein
MAMEAKSLMTRSRTAWTVVTALVMCSRLLFAQPASTAEAESLQTAAAWTTTSDSPVAPPANQQPPTDGQLPSAKPHHYWDRATQLLGAAKAGDLDAQYDLFAVIDWCNNIMDWYFTAEGRPLTLEEGLEKAPNASLKRLAETEFPHCRRFREHSTAVELGTAEYWLESATQSGQALAQAVTAERILNRQWQAAFDQLLVERLGGPRATGTAVAVTNFVGPAPDPQAVALLRAAVTSLKPGVLEIIGRAQNNLHPSPRHDAVIVALMFPEMAVTQA